MQVLNVIINSIFQLIFFSLIPFLWWFFIFRKEKSFFKYIGLKKAIIKYSVLKFIALILVASIIYIFLTSIIMNQLLDNTNITRNQFYNKGWYVFIEILFYAIIQTALSEEVFFRGFLCKQLSNRYGFIAGNTIQATVFGLLHGIPFGIATNNILILILLTLLPGAFGFFQGWINEKCSSGSIMPSWIVHSLMNILSSLMSAL